MVDLPLRVSRREVTFEGGVLTTVAGVGLGREGFVDEFGSGTVGCCFLSLVDRFFLAIGDCGADPTCPLGPFNADNNELTRSDPVPV